MKPKIIVISTLFLALLACEKEADINLPVEKSLVVANSLFSPDSLFRIQLSMSGSVQTFNRTDLISGAKVQLLDENNKLLEVLSEKGKGNYLSKTTPIENKLYKLHVDHLGQTVSAESKVPKAVAIRSVRMKKGRSIDARYNVDKDYLLWEIDIDDPENEDNYYFLNLQNVSEFNGIENVSTRELEGNDGIYEQFQSTISVRYKVLFTDETFNGKAKTLKTKTMINGFGGIHNNTHYRFVLYCCSKELYNYLLSSYYQRNQLAFEHSNKPIRVNSNIEGGLGIFGAYATDSYKLNSKDLNKLLE